MKEKSKNFALVQNYEHLLKSLNDSDESMGLDQEVPVSTGFCQENVNTITLENSPSILSNFRICLPPSTFTLPEDASQDNLIVMGNIPTCVNEDSNHSDSRLSRNWCDDSRLHNSIENTSCSSTNSYTCYSNPPPYSASVHSSNPASRSEHKVSASSHQQILSSVSSSPLSSSVPQSLSPFPVLAPSMPYLSTSHNSPSSSTSSIPSTQQQQSQYQVFSDSVTPTSSMADTLSSLRLPLCSPTISSSVYNDNTLNVTNSISPIPTTAAALISHDFKHSSNSQTSYDSTPDIVPKGEDLKFTDLDSLTFYDNYTSHGFKGNKQELNQPAGQPEEVIFDQFVTIFRQDLEKDRGSLDLSSDPQSWSNVEVARFVKWVCWKNDQPDISNQLSVFDGASLCSWSQDNFISRYGQSGDKVFLELDLWKAANKYYQQDILPTPCISPSPSTMSNNSLDNSMFQSSLDDVFYNYPEHIKMETEIIPSPTLGIKNIKEEVDSTTNNEVISNNCLNLKARMGRGHKKAITLWQFILNLLISEKKDYTDCIQWTDKQRHIFKIVDSKKVAKMWGETKSRPAMNYDKLSRSIRQYYKKGIIKKPEKTKRLVYQFCEGIVDVKKIYS